MAGKTYSITNGSKGNPDGMSHLDRYILSQLIGPFGFFALVFTGILWLTQSLKFLDTVVANGQSALVFVEFSTLVFPQVMIFVIPLSVFAASLYTLNKLYVESELVVMLSAGRGPFQLARPLLIFGAMGMCGLAIVTLYLYPVSATRLGDRLAEVKQEFTNSLIVEGKFVHPAKGVTLYIRDTNDEGEMAGIFIHDARDEAAPATYSAKRAVLVANDSVSRIVMFDGAVQQLDAPTDAIDTVVFDRLAYDLNEFMGVATERARRPREYFFHEGVSPSADLLTRGRSLGEYVSEAHDKIAAPLLTLTLPILALGAILSGSFKRNGFGTRISLGVGLMIFVQALAVAAKGRVESQPLNWTTAYVPFLISVVFGLSLLLLAIRQKRKRATR